MAGLDQLAQMRLTQMQAAQQTAATAPRPTIAKPMGQRGAEEMPMTPEERLSYSRYAPQDEEAGGLDALLMESMGKQKNPRQPNFPSAGAPGKGGALESLLWRVPDHYDHLHLAQTKGIVPLGKKLQKMGFAVGEHPKFGGVDPVHTPGSHHYSRDALDLNYRGGGRWNSEPQALDWLNKWLRKNYGVS